MPRLMPTAHCASPTGPAAAGISRLGGEQSGLVCLPCRPARGHRTWGRAVERTTRPGIYVTRQAAGLWTLAVCSLAREEEKSMLSLTASLISKQNRGKQNRNQSTPPLLSGPSWSGSGWRTGDSEIRVTRATPERAPGVTPASSSLLQFGAEVPLPTVAPAFLGLPRRLVPTAPPSPSAGLRGAGMGGPGAEPLAAQCSERPPSATGGTSQPPGHESSQQRVQRSISNRVQRSRSGGQRKLTASPGAQVKGQAKVSAGSWPPIGRHGQSGPSKGGSPRSSVTTWSDVTAPCQGAAEGLSLASEGPVCPTS